jgi:hypothetical protein
VRPFGADGFRPFRARVFVLLIAYVLRPFRAIGFVDKENQSIQTKVVDFKFIAFNKPQQ